MKNKYYFFKRLYKDFVIIFIDKDNNMRSYEVDSILVKYIKNEDNQNLNFEFVITDNVIIKKIIPEIKNLLSLIIILRTG